MTVSVEYEALERDAAKLDLIAAKMVSMRGTVSGLKLRTQQFSWNGGGAYQAYEAMIAQLDDVLKSGGAEMTGAATALRDVRAAYIQDETAAAADLAGLWEKED
ncbi:MAG: hypothetical protein LBT54_04120 [Bifidobacteriaceae bacterium]|jgi:hypothetical protein|nr:hypothetical protein [Bifidobacteriaceae bacterium]